MNQSKSAAPLPEQLKALENLQEIDLKIDQLTKQKDSFPSALKTLDDELTKLQARFKAKNTSLEDLEKIQRQTTAALELNRDRLARSNAKLESVQNSNEFQAVHKELDQLKKLNATLEEQIKNSETDRETAKNDKDVIQTLLTERQTARDSQASSLSGQSGKLADQIKELTAERARFTSIVDPRVLTQYDRVRKARGGIGIVPAVSGRCQGCNMMVPPQLYNEIQRVSSLHACPSCHRLLFVRTQTAS